MAYAAVEYVHQTADGTWRLTDSRVSLDSVVYAYWEGKSPEGIAEEFPTLSAEYVYGALAFYLRNKGEIDAYLSQRAQQWEHLRQVSQTHHGPLLDRIRASRRATAGDEPLP